MARALIGKIKNALRRSPLSQLLDPHGKAEFVKRCPQGARLLDVGCGGNSPFQIKSTRPDLHYVGLDVGDYRQTSEGIALANEYIIVSPEEFASAITGIAAKSGRFDAIISAHNIEHCLEPDLVLSAMMSALKPGGRLFLSFPSEASTNFPSREDTLNFFDDPTHLSVPDFYRIVERIDSGGLTAVVLHRQYQPFLYYVLGMLIEPISAMRRRTMRGTWAYYGFETVIWANASK